MRLSEEQIKEAILHPEQEVRREAVGYWADAYGRDETIMPLVIQSVERYGRDSAFRIMRKADALAQTPTTVEWLIAELRRDYDIRDVVQDNYRFAVALALVDADPELLVRRHKEIVGLAGFPGQLRRPLEDRLRLHLMDWPQLWAELERYGLKTMKQGELTLRDYRDVRRLLDAMGRHGDHADKVLRTLDGKVSRSKKTLAAWLIPDLVDLAGRMRLPQAVPRIMRWISQGEDAVVDRCGLALGQIGTDVVVNEIAHGWQRFDIDRRLTLCEALDNIHTDRCIAQCLAFLDEEEDFEVALWLAGVLLSHFCADGVRYACELALDDSEEMTNDQRDLKFRAVAVATAMEMDFPEYEQWRAEAVEANYGWGDLERGRISEYF